VAKLRASLGVGVEQVSGEPRLATLAFDTIVTGQSCNGVRKPSLTEWTQHNFIDEIVEVEWQVDPVRFNETSDNKAPNFLLVFITNVFFA
jgi:hypothetical protein